jgi:type VI secretion system protein ImpH
MSTTRRRKDTSVVKQLAQRPFDYTFKQAVRLLERAATFLNHDARAFAKNPVARFSPPANEVVRFHSRQSMSFPSAELENISIKKNDAAPNQWRVFVNFMGLTGSSGVLPYHYSELVLQRFKHKDKSMMNFLDLFNHRTISLFYQASTKYNLPLEYERKKLNPPPGGDTDNHTQILLALIGLGSRGLQHRLYTKDESLLYYAGLFSSKVRSPSGLKQIINNHFGIPVEIKEFIGQWQELIDDVRTRLPGFAVPRGQNNQLGKSLMLGRKGWFAQGKIRIILGPLSSDQLHNFAPGTATLKTLDEIVRLYINFEYDYDYVMRIKRADIPDRIRLNKMTPSIMGWNTWLSPKVGKYTDSQTTVDIPVSAHRLR